MEIRECNKCDWVGWGDDCINSKLVASFTLCPDCHETTFIITPRYIFELHQKLEEERYN